MAQRASGVTETNIIMPTKVNQIGIDDHRNLTASNPITIRLPKVKMG
ncbi:MAG: hypothetical protein NTY03_15975 [Candidatus Bathyarchaeota archaeon]|nr:hypothetical protein [Candidatus Bathyarchaeota archaeon]